MLRSDVDSKTIFEPLRTRGALADWRVRATLPSGKQVWLGAFDSEAAAREWIVLKSAGWRQLRECERRLFGLA